MKRTSSRAAAGIALLLVQIACARSTGSHTASDDPFADLRTAVTTRPFSARLSGGFAYAPLAEVTRAASVSAPSVDIRLAAARLEKRLSSARSPDALADFAAASLLSRNTGAAVEALEDAVSLAPRNARILSDLAAAYLARAEAARQPTVDHVRALDAALMAASIDPRMPEAWFNRALALDALLPAVVVRAAWDDFLRIEQSPAWLAEARSRAAQPRLAAPTIPTFDSLPLEGIPAAVNLAPQSAREAFMELLVPAWASATRQRNSAAARTLLNRADAMAEALLDRTRDPFAKHTVRRMRDPRYALATASAYREYVDARAKYLAEDPSGAERRFRELFARLSVGDPLRIWVGLSLATIAIDRREIVAGTKLLQEPIRRARAAGYAAASARASWLLGLTQHHANAIDAALTSYRSAAATFARLGERENELSMYNIMADNMRLRGERRESWEYILHVLSGSRELPTPRRRYLAFLNAALFAADEGWTRAALTFQDSAVSEAKVAPSPGFAIEALTTKAELLFASGDNAAAEATLADAERALATFGERPYAAARISATRGAGYAVHQPGRAEPDLTAALAFFTKAEPAEAARLHLLRGRVRLRRGDVAGAEADWMAGIRDVERRRAATLASGLRVAYLDAVADLFTEMASLQMSHRRNPDRAFHVVELGRARVLLDTSRAPVLTAEQIQGRLPRGAALLVFKIIGPKVVCWVFTSAGRSSLELPASDIADQAAAFRRQLPSASADVLRRNAQRLYLSVLGPIEKHFAGADTLIIVPDGALVLIPFAALVSAKGRYLIEDYAVSTMASASAFAAATNRVRDISTPARALLVTDPALDPVGFPGLPRLPGAQAEVDAIAAHYRAPRVLAGAAATPSAFVRALPDADVVHFGGHAVEDRENPNRSALLFASDRSGAESGALRAHQIAGHRVSRTRLVVLAACDTGTGPVTRGEGVHSLARSFLEAGVPNVVATLWKVDDALASQLFRRFHRYYASSGDPTSALRSAQLDMLGSADPTLASPKAWSAAISIGAAGSVSENLHRLSSGRYGK